jgi:hypothetical protein
MAASLLLQCGVSAGAEEEQAQAETAAVTETASPETQAPTEAPQTQAPTEAPQTEAPQTQAPTEAPQTEAPTESQQTQAPTEKQTETEKKKKEKEKETETEAARSAYENDGDKVTADQLVSKLGDALDYLLVADTVKADEKLLKDQQIADGDVAASILANLKDFSVELANARSSKSVEVINLYADKDGKLDLTQLEDAYADHVIDVTDKYFVVNVIADSAKQDLDFSGYDMLFAGEKVNYTEETQPGDILYNFAAWDDGEFTAYQGSVTLSKSSGLQGTFLAPKAEVKLTSSLSGAVFADTVKVADTVTELLQIGFVNGRAAVEIETEAETEAKTEAATEVQTEAPTEEAPETEAVTEAPTEASQPAAATETEPVEATETELIMETDLAEELALNAPEEPTAISDETVSASLTVRALDADGNPLTDGSVIHNAVFVVKDSAGNYLTGSDGTVQKVVYDGSTVTETTPCQIDGLLAGVAYTLVQLSTDDGYQIAEDTVLTPAEGDEASLQLTVDNRISGGSASAEVRVTASYNDVELTAAKDVSTGKYVALFKETTDDAGSTEPVLKRISGIQELAYTKDSSVSTVTFTGLEDGTYTLAEVDAQGERITDALAIAQQEVTVQAATDAAQAASAVVEATLQYPSGQYPTNDFYYIADVTVTNEVKETNGTAKKVTEAFAATLYSDAQHTTQAAALSFSLSSSASLTQTTSIQVAQATATYYLVETGWKGAAISASFPYDITYDGGNAAEAVIQIACAQDSEDGVSTKGSATITNTVKSQATVVKINADRTNVKLVVKDSTGKIVAGPFTSASSSTTVTGYLTAGQTYYLSEVSAPSGYAPAKDKKFTVENGKTTEVILTHSKAATTEYQIAVTKQVYAGDYQVYANNSGGSYDFYAALFEDADHLVKVSDVVKITVDKLSGTGTFKNLEKNKTYYVAETNANGQVIESSQTLKIQYENGGAVKTSSKESTTTIQNRYSSLPKGYRYSASLTLAVNVTDNSNQATAVSGTFYIGIYRKADYSDTPNIISVALDNKSSASVKQRILLPGTTDEAYKDITYYFAEVDSKGNRLTDSSDFEYNISIDTPQLTLTKGDVKTVTVTNQKKSDSKVTLTLTKKVYEGSSPKNVTETFYAGLFKDSSFTQAYTKPIALNLKNKSSITLKLTLNLGTASSATIYVAEVDSQGNVITDQQGFGYEIMMDNSTAAFTQGGQNITTTLINSVYGTSTSDDWNDIVSQNNLGTNDSLSANGEASAGTTAGDVQTGDTTPIGMYLLLMLAAAIGFGGTIVIRRRRSNS